MNTARVSRLAVHAVVIALANATAFARNPADWGQTPKPQAKALVDRAVEQSRDDLGKAEKLLEKATREDPTYYRAQRNLGLIRLAQNNSPEAVTELQKALEIQKTKHIDDPTIWAELGFAYDRADMPEKAATAFQTGAEKIGELSPSEQKKLLERGAAFYVLRQDPKRARELLESAGPGVNPETAIDVENFIDQSVETLTRNDVQEGWVSFGRQNTSGTPGEWEQVLFRRTEDGPLPPKRGDTITPLDQVVNIRADHRRLGNQGTQLGTQLGTPIGFARPGETFTLIQDPVAVPLDEPLKGWTAWWVKVRRVNNR
jgi:hypothetical protein